MAEALLTALATIGKSTATLEYTGSTSARDAEQRSAAVQEYKTALCADVMASPSVALAAYVLNGTKQPRAKVTPKSIKDSLTDVADIEQVRKHDLTARMDFHTELSKALHQLAGKINKSLGATAQAHLTRIPGYRLAWLSGDPSEMLKIIQTLFEARTYGMDVDETNTAATQSAVNAAQLPKETYVEYARRLNDLVKLALEKHLLGDGWLPFNTAHVYWAGLDESTYGKSLLDAKASKAYGGLSSLNTVSGIAAMLGILGAPLLPLLKTGKERDTDATIMAYEHRDPAPKRDRGGTVSEKEWDPTHCALCRRLIYTGKQAGTIKRHYASDCPHPSVSDEERESARKRYQDRVAKRKEHKGKKPKEKEKEKQATVAAVVEVQSGASSETDKDNFRRMMFEAINSSLQEGWMVLGPEVPPNEKEEDDQLDQLDQDDWKGLPDLFPTETTSTSNEETQVYVNTAKESRTILDSGASKSCSKTEGKNTIPLKIPIQIQGLGGKVEVTHITNSVVDDMDAMLVKSGMGGTTLENIISLGQATNTYQPHPHGLRRALHPSHSPQE